MIVIHHLENSRSQRVLWLLEELGVPYDVKRYERDKKTNLAPPALMKVHPLGKSPVLDDDGVIVAETGAIMEHILDIYGKGRLQPARGTAEWNRYRYWMHAAEGSYMPPMVLTLLLNRMETAPMPFFAKPIAKRLVGAVKEGYLDHTVKALFEYLDAELRRSEWLAGGAFSAADIMMSFPIEAASQRSPYAKGVKSFEAFVKKTHARPAYKKALERGGPYVYA